VIDVEDGVKLGRIGFSEAEALFREIIGQPLGDRYERRSNDEKLSTLRSRAIGSLIDACGAAFVGPARDFLAGHAPMALIDATPQAAVAVQLKRLALTRVYRWDRMVTEELKGISVIHRLLDLFVPAAVAVKRNAVVSRLCALVPHFNPGASRYERLLSVTDYISGMTDRYAMDMHERLGDVSL
jgi:dGTPase